VYSASMVNTIGRVYRPSVDGTLLPAVMYSSTMASFHTPPAFDAGTSATEMLPSLEKGGEGVAQCTKF